MSLLAPASIAAGLIGCGLFLWAAVGTGSERNATVGIACMAVAVLGFMFS